MSVHRYFLFAVMALYLPSSHAAWLCRNILEESDGMLILFRINKLEQSGSWIPADNELGAYKAFRDTLPSEVQNIATLTELLKRSSNLRKALVTFINSLDASYEVKESDNPVLIANHFTKVLFNNGESRIASATEISKLLRDCEITAASKYSTDDYAKLSPEVKVAAIAKAIDGALETRWNDSADTDVVYGWMTADRNPEVDNQLWGAGEEAPSNIIVNLPASQRNVQALVEKHRNIPLIKNGEIYRDKFRAALEDFEKDSLKTLHDKYEALFKLKDLGAMDDVGKLLSPYANPIEGKPTEIYLSKSLDVLKRLFASAHFFKEFVAFKEAYVEACEALLDLTKDTQLTLFERRKLSTIAEEYIVSYSIDLLSIGLNYNPPHEYRYRPLLIQMQRLNGQLQRYVVPVGALLNIGSNNGNTGSIIIQP